VAGRRADHDLGAWPQELRQLLQDRILGESIAMYSTGMQRDYGGCDLVVV
jgi:hypothetical protein